MRHVPIFAVIGLCVCSCSAKGPGDPLDCTDMPVAGTSCGKEGARCVYGDDIDLACRSSAVCQSGAWAIVDPPARCTEPPPDSCPSTQPPPSTECADANIGDHCAYQTGSSLCLCTDTLCTGACQLLDPPQWYCFPPPAADCPAIAPNPGDSCTTEDLRCDYQGGVCSSDGISLRCTSGTFVEILYEPCPA